jgi:hypothetical protein
MADGFDVVVGEVRAHAEAVTSVAEAVRSASSGSRDAVSGGAFGQIAEFFASVMTQACGEVRSVADRASVTVDQVVAGLSAVADAYQAVDERHASLFDQAVPTAETGGVRA